MKKELILFERHWNLGLSVPLSSENEREGWEEDAYAIYEDIWNPTNLVRLGDFGMTKTLEIDFWTSDFFLIRDQLTVHMANSDQDFEMALDGQLRYLQKDDVLCHFRSHVITNFTPDVALVRGKIISLTSKRESRFRSIFRATQRLRPQWACI